VRLVFSRKAFENLKFKCVFQGNKMQSKLGLLMLLSMWLSHCPLAVKQFVSIPTSIPYLTTQVGEMWCARRSTL
jgi:hypothetical protein